MQSFTVYSIIERIFLIFSFCPLDRPVVGLRRITIFSPPVGPDFGTVQKSPIASSAWTWSAIRNTAVDETFEEKGIEEQWTEAFGDLSLGQGLLKHTHWGSHPAGERWDNYDQGDLRIL